MFLFIVKICSKTPFFVVSVMLLLAAFVQVCNSESLLTLLSLFLPAISAGFLAVLAVPAALFYLFRLGSTWILFISPLVPIKVILLMLGSVTSKHCRLRPADRPNLTKFSFRIEKSSRRALIVPVEHFWRLNSLVIFHLDCDFLHFAV